MKFFLNERVALAWAVLIEIVVHLLFAFQAFLLGGFLGDIALKSMFGPYGAVIGSWALGIFIFGAAFQAFVLGEYMREHVESFELTPKGNGSYIRAWWLSLILVACLELASLAFRVLVTVNAGDYKQAWVIGAFGVIALAYAFMQAKVIHASVNRPVEHDMMMAQEMAGKSLVMDSMKYTRYMTPEQKARFNDGDVSAISEVAQDGFFEQEQKRQAGQRKKDAKLQAERAKQSQKEKAAMDHRNAGDMASKLLHPSRWKIQNADQPKYTEDFMEAQSNQANHLSQNNGRPK